MSKLEQLIQKYCPSGVEYRPLGELGSFYGGLSGKTKEDFKDGNAKFISYKNIYANPSLNIDTEERVRIAEGEKQHTIQYGDILFTGSSETPDECGISSVMTKHTDEKLYLNSFCFGFRLNDLSLFNPDFLKHLFRSEELRVQIGKTASGTTRFNVSKARFAKVSIPLPPLPVQEEIVRILDIFSNYTAELQAELQKRKQQYNYYRDNLLSFEGRDDVEWKKLGEVCRFVNGRAYKKDELLKDGKYKVLRVGNFFTNDMWYYSDLELEEEKYCKEGDLLYAWSASFGPRIWDGGKTIFHYHIWNVKFDENTISKRYLYHFFAWDVNNLYSSKTGSTMVHVSMENMNKRFFPLLPLSEQERIANILDRFDTLTNDLTSGLPAEIEKRKQQYEYYRDKLLTFKRKEA